MGKFLKVCLISACISIVLGMLILIGVAVSGNGKEVFYAVENGGIYFDKEGFHVGNSVILENKAEMSSGIVDGKEYTYAADEIEKLQMELKAGEFVILSGDSNEIKIRADKKIKISNDGDCIELETADRIIGLGQNELQNVEITLPKDHKFHKMEIEVGAGEMNADVLMADSISLDLGAGKIQIGRMECENSEINVGAGEVIVEEGHTDTMDLNVGMGSFCMNGSITGDLDADCGMGNLDMTLLGQDTDHSYDVDCGMGCVRIGDVTYSDMKSEQKVDNNTDSEFDLDCAMGNINFNFED